MKKILQKRITFFSNIFLVLLSISLLLLIYKIDSEESRYDMNFIQELKKIDEIDIEEMLRNGSIETKIYHWLYQNDSTLWAENKYARISLVRILVHEYGWPHDEISAVKGIESGKYNFNLIGIDTAFINELKIFEYSAGLNNVEECLIKLKLLSEPLRSVVLYSIDPEALRQSIDVRFLGSVTSSDDAETEEMSAYYGEEEENENPRQLIFNRVNRITGIKFIDGRFVIETEFGGRNIQAAPIATPSVPLEGLEKVVIVESFLVLMDMKNQIVGELIRDHKLFNRIRATYGHLYIDDCIKVLSEENTKISKSVSVFGFQFSRQRVVMAFLFFFFLSAVGLFYTISRAWKNRLNIISEILVDDTLFMIIENKYSRFILWCLSPVFVVALTFEISSTSWKDLLIILFLLLSILFFNIKSYLLSLKI